MEMCYDGALVMPSNYAVMGEEEMIYVEGGVAPITVTADMLKQSYCMSIAKNYMAETGMSQLRIAMEIYAHAVLFFGGISVAAIVGLDNKLVADIVNRANPIDLGGDSIGRLALYTAIWLAPNPFSNPIIV